MLSRLGITILVYNTYTELLTMGFRINWKLHVNRCINACCFVSLSDSGSQAAEMLTEYSEKTNFTEEREERTLSAANHIDVNFSLIFLAGLQYILLNTNQIIIVQYLYCTKLRYWYSYIFGCEF